MKKRAVLALNQIFARPSYAPLAAADLDGNATQHWSPRVTPEEKLRSLVEIKRPRSSGRPSPHIVYRCIPSLAFAPWAVAAVLAFGVLQRLPALRAVQTDVTGPRCVLVTGHKVGTHCVSKAQRSVWGTQHEREPYKPSGAAQHNARPGSGRGARNSVHRCPGFHGNNFAVSPWHQQQTQACGSLKQQRGESPNPPPCWRKKARNGHLVLHHGHAGRRLHNRASRRPPRRTPVGWGP